MNCHDEYSVIGYVDGELDAMRALEVEAHLKECPTCAATLEQYRSLRGSLQSSELYFKAAPHLEASVRSRLRETGAFDTRPTVRNSFSNWKLVAAAASLVIDRMPAGRRFVAVGMNPAAARVLAISVERYRLLTYAAAGLCYATAGVMLAGFLNIPSLLAGDT